jgi:hypothetical protein
VLIIAFGARKQPAAVATGPRGSARAARPAAPAGGEWPSTLSRRPGPGCRSRRREGVGDIDSPLSTRADQARRAHRVAVDHGRVVGVVDLHPAACAI